MNTVELTGISKTFTDSGEPNTVLQGVDLTIKQGEFVAIMGPSGSGKSTLMNIIGLLDVPTEGTYKIEGQSTARYNQAGLAKLRRQRIGFVFQTFNLLGRLSLKQNVELPMAYAGVPSKDRSAKALELLKRVGLTDRANYRPNQVSGGQVQRAAIARALANDPALILADEPTGNLDSKSGADVMNLLEQLHKSGNTIIMVSHDHDIASHAQRIINVRDGQIITPETGGSK